MPNFIVHIIRTLLVNNHPEAVIGDLEEEYINILLNKGKSFAAFWLLGQILSLIPLHYKNSLYWSIGMFKNYFKIGFRNLIKEKLISIISIAGLGIGIAAAGLIMIYVHFENSYDKFFDNSDKIYRIYTKLENPKDNKLGYGVVAGKLTLPIREIQDVQDATSLYKYRVVDIKVDQDKFSNLNVFAADSSLFNVLNYKSVKGNLKTVLANPSSAVITENIAMKFWGKIDVIGNNIEFSSNFFDNKIFSVGAVIENVPINSHLQFDILLSIYANPILESDYFGGDEFLTYFKLTDFANKTEALDKVSDVFEKVNLPRREIGYDGHAGIIPIKDIHLKGSAYFNNLSGNGDIAFVFILLLVAAAILFIAVLNFINLLTAKFQNRFNEVAVRKVVGANKGAILLQFISEALLISSLSSIISILLLLFLLNDFGLLVNRELSIYYDSILSIAVLIVSLSAFVAVISAIFPALRIARLKCVNILKNKSGSSKINRLLPATVIVQFSVVIILIASISVIYFQVEFMKNQNLGFEPEQLVYFKYTDNEKYNSIKNKLEELPDIVSVTASQSIPGKGRSGQLGKIQGSEIENISFSENRIKSDYLKTYGINLIAGREFNRDLISDKEAAIINEAFIKMMNISPTQALERKLEYNGRHLQIIGVMNDYRFSSFESEISPLALTNYMDRMNTITVKINTQDIKKTLNKIEELVKEFSSDFVFEYSFVDELFGQMYREIEINNILLIYSAVLAIILSVMGLFAVTLFAVNRRTKEIGIRKVLGGTVTELNFLLIKNYLVWVLISNLIAWPITYYFLRMWLQNFTIQITLHPGYFLFSGILAFLIALSTIIFITTRAALTNPVENLRYE